MGQFKLDSSFLWWTSFIWMICCVDNLEKKFHLNIAFCWDWNKSNLFFTISLSIFFFDSSLIHQLIRWCLCLMMMMVVGVGWMCCWWQIFKPNRIKIHIPSDNTNVDDDNTNEHNNNNNYNHHIFPSPSKQMWTSIHR